MRVATVVGTRPEIIRLSRIVPLLDAHCTHCLVHTGQNYDPLLSDVFFTELGVRPPDERLGITASGFAAQVGAMLPAVAAAFERCRPDRVLILGDTNSGLAALVAARLGIPVFHMEAGNRCYDDRVPEEINRRVIDHSSTILMPYTERSKENLVREGIERERIFVTGNPIREVLDHYGPQIAASDALPRFGVAPRGYFLMTMHRAENVDDPARLARLVDAVVRVSSEQQAPVLFSVHPRTADRLRATGLAPDPARVRTLEPLGFFDFVSLERQARAVISDSGTVQEECAIFQVPTVTIRDVTERPETIECGSNILSGAEPDAVSRAMQLVLQLPTAWTPPWEYRATGVSAIVARIVLGRLSLRKHLG
ncbi:MAG: non-hydrolyzing UDP-N-acetylglucosamine 2-epimerase [Vicinamibacterales bacterium]